MTRYLDHVYNVLGYEPRESGSAKTELARIEQQLGRALPQSVGEWYSKEGAIELMATRSSDSPVKLDQLGLPAQLFEQLGEPPSRPQRSEPAVLGPSGAMV
ncbi:MAG TPA: hypothetical protein VJX67_01845 [Blastocatellia bacterium]|nr:hypothetical protein [Blastocatellia bacterium]